MATKPEVPFRPAAHVQAAMAAAQAKPAADSRPRAPIAAHVQAALHVAQAKSAPTSNTPRPVAPHVQAALRVAQAKLAEAPQAGISGLRGPATVLWSAAMVSRPAAAPGHTRHLRPAATLQRMVEEAVTIHYCDNAECEWFEVGQNNVSHCEGCKQDFSLMELGEQGRNALKNIEEQIRYWAKRRAKKDNSGHGKDKKINSGHSSDRHQVGQDRKTNRKKSLAASLEEALGSYKDAGGNEGTLDSKTIKILNKTGVKWREFLS